MKLIKVETASCASCRMLDKALKTLNIEFTSVDALDDTNLSLINEHNISHVPVLLKYDDSGKFIGKMEGFKGSELKEFLNA